MLKVAQSIQINQTDMMCWYELKQNKTQIARQLKCNNK